LLSVLTKMSFVSSRELSAAAVQSRRRMELLASLVDQGKDHHDKRNSNHNKDANPTRHRRPPIGDGV
jgi:hypothetical protein